MAETKRLRHANRVIEIPNSQVDSYRARGYEVIDEDGKVLKKATAGTSVSQADYNRLEEENLNLKSQLARTNDIDTDQYDLLEKQNKEYEARITELEDDVKSYEAETERLDNENKELKSKSKK